MEHRKEIKLYNNKLSHEINKIMKRKVEPYER